MEVGVVVIRAIARVAAQQEAAAVLRADHPEDGTHGADHLCPEHATSAAVGAEIQHGQPIQCVRDQGWPDQIVGCPGVKGARICVVRLGDVVGAAHISHLQRACG